MSQEGIKLGLIDLLRVIISKHFDPQIADLGEDVVQERLRSIVFAFAREELENAEFLDPSLELLVITHFLKYSR